MAVLSHGTIHFCSILQKEINLEFCRILTSASFKTQSLTWGLRDFFPSISQLYLISVSNFITLMAWVNGWLWSVHNTLVLVWCKQVGVLLYFSPAYSWEDVLTWDLLAVWVAHSSVVNASNLYLEGCGFDSRWGLRLFFWALYYYFRSCNLISIYNFSILGWLVDLHSQTGFQSALS